MKRLGQHFLTNRTKIKKIIDALELRNGEVVVEIGPGHGELTDELRIRNYELRIIAIEKDSILAEGLKKKFSANKNIQIIVGDALKILPSIIRNSPFVIQKYKLVGNIPYYITGHLLRVIGELKQKPLLIVLTVQKEVAERICAKPPRMNLLAASVRYWAEPEIVDFIPKTDFSPPPKVDSAVIRLRVKNRELRIKPEKYYRLIKIIFKQPRKTLLNNLADGLKQGVKKPELTALINELGLKPDIRPQNLDLTTILKVGDKLAPYL
ncbi:MAG: ribosomal RNA small subunit methyltransferase A [Parcubacteria group bacterium]|nr:ribosomal RNA small subunit methyltransferase A [Parcubacteria group bacterium]